MNSCNNLLILKWNVRSLMSRFLDLSEFLFKNKCQIALISETWLLPNKKVSIPHFHVTRSDRIYGFGCVGILSHHSIQFKPMSVDTIIAHTLLSYSIDLVGIKVLLPNNNPLQLWSVYIPPSSNPKSYVLSQMFNLFSQNSIIGGDFNP